MRKDCDDVCILLGPHTLWQKVSFFFRNFIYRLIKRVDGVPNKKMTKLYSIWYIQFPKRSFKLFKKQTHYTYDGAKAWFDIT